MEHSFKNKDIIIHPWKFDEGDVRSWENQRFDLQHNGELLKFGASEVSQVIGQGYESAFKLFQIKLGKVAPKKPNLIMCHGNQVEDVIMRYARAYDINDPSSERTAENFLDGNWQRNIQKAEYFIESPKYKAILCSLDGVLFKGEQDFEGNIAEFDTPVEFKNVSASSFSRWNNEIPIYYLVQDYCQLMFTGAPHMWFVVLVDNRELWIQKVEANEEWFEYIDTNTVDLSLRISKAKLIQEQLEQEDDSETRDKLQKMIWELEPEVTADEADGRILKEMYPVNDDIKLGDQNDLDNVLKYLHYSAEEKECKSQKDLAKNNLLVSMKGSKLEVISEEGQGYIVKGGNRFTVSKKK